MANEAKCKKKQRSRYKPEQLAVINAQRAKKRDKVQASQKAKLDRKRLHRAIAGKAPTRCERRRLNAQLKARGVQPWTGDWFSQYKELAKTRR